MDKTLLNRPIAPEYGQDPIGNIIDRHLFATKTTIHSMLGQKEDYVVTRSDCFKVCELVLRHFVLNYGHDDLLPTFGIGTNQVIESYQKGEMNHFPVKINPTNQ